MVDPRRQPGPAAAQRPASVSRPQVAAAVTDGPELVTIMKAAGCGLTKLEVARQELIDKHALGGRATAEDVYAALERDRRVFPGVLEKVRLIIQTGSWEQPPDSSKRPDIEDVILAGLPPGIEYTDDGEPIRSMSPPPRGPLPSGGRPLDATGHTAGAAMPMTRNNWGGDPRVGVTPSLRVLAPTAADNLLNPAPPPGTEAEQMSNDPPPMRHFTPSDSPDVAPPVPVADQRPADTRANVIVTEPTTGGTLTRPPDHPVTMGRPSVAQQEQQGTSPSPPPPSPESPASPPAPPPSPPSPPTPPAPPPPPPPPPAVPASPPPPPATNATAGPQPPQPAGGSSPAPPGPQPPRGGRGNTRT